MKANGTVSFHTLGCKLNFSETSSIARMFEEKGFVKVNADECPDIYVINTCSVTSNADKECKQLVKQVLQKSPGTFVAVIGCYAQLKPNEIASIEGVDLVLGASEKFNLTSYLNSFDKKNKAEIHSCDINHLEGFNNAYSIGDRTRAFLKVQDGCDYTCSFCTIPLARGKSRSDSIENIIASAHEIAGKGIKEIVLTGVNIGDFGKLNTGIKSTSETFFNLIKELDEISTIERFRISSIEPNLLTNEIIEFVANSKRFAPHFHIPLQSGSNNILKKMRRRYLRELYADRVSSIKNLMPHCCIGADVIVGFPSETEEDFMETFTFLKEIDISYLHVFTYSERDNTHALTLPNPVPIEERKRRNKMLRILSAKKTHAFYEKHINTERPVLFESENKDGHMHGFTDNYIKVKIPYNPALSNKILNVKLHSIDNNACMTIEQSNKPIISNTDVR